MLADKTMKAPCWHRDKLHFSFLMLAEELASVLMLIYGTGLKGGYL
jgi:hypothetical protein